VTDSSAPPLDSERAVGYSEVNRRAGGLLFGLEVPVKDVTYSLDYILWGYDRKNERGVCLRRRSKTTNMSMNSAQEPPSRRRFFLCCVERSGRRL
jgi:hypothetical protein